MMRCAIIACRFNECSFRSSWGHEPRISTNSNKISFPIILFHAKLADKSVDFKPYWLNMSLWYSFCHNESQGLTL